MFLICITSVFLFWSSAALAQNAGLSADEVIQDYIAASGLEELASVQTVKMTGRYSFRGIDYPITILKMRPHFFRFELLDNGKKSILGYDGKTAWELDESQSSQAKVAEHPFTQTYIRAYADFDGPLFQFKQKGHEVVMRGIERVDGEEARRLYLTRADSGRETWFISTSSFLPVKRSMKIAVGENEYAQDYFYMDYETTAGVTLPHYIERLEAHYVHSYEIENIEFDVQLDTSLFKMLDQND